MQYVFKLLLKVNKQAFTEAIVQRQYKHHGDRSTARPNKKLAVDHCSTVGYCQLVSVTPCK